MIAMGMGNKDGNILSRKLFRDDYAACKALLSIGRMLSPAVKNQKMPLRFYCKAAVVKIRDLRLHSPLSIGFLSIYYYNQKTAPAGRFF